LNDSSSPNTEQAQPGLHAHLDALSPRLAEEQARMRARTAEDAAANHVDPKLRPYKIDDLMVLHNLSRKTVIRLYENEPGVEVLSDLRCTGRHYRTIRVPRHVYARVKHRMEVR
jgi:hypothetical protein